jgi:hypothetical protein
VGKYRKGNNNINGSNKSDTNRNNIDNNEMQEWDLLITDEYIQIVTLVGMCFAGYYTIPNNDNNSNNDNNRMKNDRSSWKTMCQHVISQLNTVQRKASAYLLAGCYFLLANINNNNDYNSYLSIKNNNTNINNDISESMIYSNILQDSRIALEDKIAFAVTYLNDLQFLQWCNYYKNYCLINGCLEGLLLTGMSSDGYAILQAYVDKTSDIQTIALIVSRMLENNVSSNYSDNKTVTVSLSITTVL